MAPVTVGNTSGREAAAVAERRVLIIDDEPVVRDVVARYLALEGYEVQAAADGAEGLRLARSWQPDLLVLDLMLPGVDGLKAALQGEVLRFPGVTINAAGRTVEADGRPVELTAKEFDLLHFLAAHAGQVFSREQLMDQVWDYQFAGDTSTVTVHIRRVREKLEADPTRPRYLKTVWGVGYKFEAGQ